MTTKKNKRFRVSVQIIIMVASIAAIIGLLRLLLIDIFHMSDAAATTLMTIGQVVAAAVGAIMIVVQLDQEREVQKEQANIQEAQFILEYNQAFIQDANMTYVEQQLETSMKSRDKEIINDENRQMFINYLVYLEGLAPLILNGVLRFEHIDDLMAYRFFLAVNNKEMQEKELMLFPDYYKGCFKLYAAWKRYRLDHNGLILQEKQALDKWLEYETYIDSEYTIRNALPSDNPDIAGVLFGTDPYIYPTAFKNKRMARKRLPLLMKLVESIFHYNNIKVAISPEGKVVGAICYYNNSVKGKIDYYAALGINSDRTRHVCDNYFSHLAGCADSDNMYYIAAICVSERYRRKGIGKMLLKSVLAEHHDKTIKLDVLCGNENAIRLYEDYGFEIVGESYKGYSYPPKERPDCYCMVRQPSNEWIIEKFKDDNETS